MRRGGQNEKSVSKLNQLNVDAVSRCCFFSLKVSFSASCEREIKKLRQTNKGDRKINLCRRQQRETHVLGYRRATNRKDSQHFALNLWNVQQALLYWWLYLEHTYTPLLKLCWLEVELAEGPKCSVGSKWDMMQLHFECVCPCMCSTTVYDTF